MAARREHEWSWDGSAWAGNVAKQTQSPMISAQFVTFLNIRRWAFYTIYCHSREGDTAPALAEFALSECSCTVNVSIVCIQLDYLHRVC